MTWIFGDGFDLYNAANFPADPIASYWDSGINGGIGAGRFSGSRAWSNSFTSNNGVMLAKSSGVNDAVHHIAVAYYTGSGALTGTSLYLGLQLLDGTTAQCTILFRSDGAIVLTSGAGTGTALATYTGAFNAINTWFQYEFEVVINNTTGSFSVRKNGNTSNDFSATGLDTQNSANAYANKLQLVGGPQGTSGSSLFIDDLLWRSDATFVPWVGDIRCVTRMPASDQSAQFSKSPGAPLTLTPWNASGTNTAGLNTAIYMSILPAYSGALSGAGANFNNAYTGNVKCALFASTGAAGSEQPGVLIQSATAVVTNPAAGFATFTFSPPISVTRGTRYYLGICCDTNTATVVGGGGSTRFCWSSATTYAAWPVSNPPSLTFASSFQLTYTLSPSVNAEFVNEAQQDALTSYVYDSVAGHADLYGISAVSGTTPGTVIAVTTRAFIQKSDVGSRTAAVQLKSSGSTVTPTTWNPSDNVACTLSGGNLTINTTNSGGARSIFGATSGKYYLELTCTTIQQFASAFGIANSTATFTTGTYINTATVQAGSGSININNVSVGGLGGSIANGTIIGIALDLTNGQIWFRRSPSGNWNNSGTANPATNTGGFSISSIVGTGLFAYIAAGSVSETYTANFGATTFSGAVPSGFNSGLGAFGSTTVASPTLTPTTSGWLWAWRTDVTDPNTALITWNFADKSANVALSNTNFTATSTSSAAGGVRASLSVTTGKYYWELSAGGAAGTNTSCGICTAGCSLTTGTNAMLWIVGGNVFMNGSLIGSPGNYNVAGNLVAIAIDVAAQLVWFRTLLPTLGSWNGSGTANPATGAGGFSFATIGGGSAIFPIVEFGASADQFTVNFGGLSFTGTMPSGFASFGGPSAAWTPAAVDNLQVGPVVVS